MKKLVTIILACIVAMSSSAQEQRKLDLALVAKIDQEIKDFTIDNLGNIYILTPGNQLKKLDQKGDSVGVYNDVRRFGKIFSVDVTNPLKVLVYYKDYSTIVILDRLLNIRANIDLKKQDILQVKVIATSYDNNIWLYDEWDSRLKKIDDSGKTLFESTDFRQIFDLVPSPEKLFDRDGQLYLYDPTKGLLVFDYYGGRKNTMQLLHLEDLQVLDKNTITARDSTGILLYKPATLQVVSYIGLTGLSSYKKVQFNGEQLFCLTKENHLEVFKIAK